MNILTGAPIAGDAHLVQSIGDILSTPIGSRVMLRDYGSALFELVDAPFNPATRLRMYAATAVALQKWEPRIALTRVSIAPDAETRGAFEITLEGNRTDSPSPNSLTTLTLPLRLAGATN
ncbi:GPW/gp25 family protein [Sphingomonas oryzagri]